MCAYCYLRLNVSLLGSNKCELVPMWYLAPVSDGQSCQNLDRQHLLLAFKIQDLQHPVFQGFSEDMPAFVLVSMCCPISVAIFAKLCSGHIL